MSLNQFIKLSHGIDTDQLNEVLVTAMNEEQRESSLPVVQPNRCFDNCFQLAMHLNATYVLGIYHHLIPIEHAWLKVGDTYIDPTLEVVTGEVKGTYLSLVEVRATELIDFVVEIDRITKEGAFPPMFETVRRHPEYRGRFISCKERSQFFGGKLVNL